MPDNENESKDEAWTQTVVPNAEAASSTPKVTIKNGLSYIAIAFVLIAGGVAAASLFGLIEHVPADVIIVFLAVATFFVELIRLYLDHFKVAL
jgi:hypothetical protein